MIRCAHSCPHRTQVTFSCRAFCCHLCEPQRGHLIGSPFSFLVIHSCPQLAHLHSVTAVRPSSFVVLVLFFMKRTMHYKFAYVKSKFYRNCKIFWGLFGQRPVSVS
jgi:hypothetical protein